MVNLNNFLKIMRGKWLPSILAYLKDPLLLNKWVNENLHMPDPNRLTVWVNDGYRTPISRDKYIGDVFMFVEDLHLHVMPFRHRRRDAGSGYSANITPSNRAIEEQVARLLSGDRFSRDLSDSLAEFIRSNVQSIVTHGKIAYEVKVTREENGTISDMKVYAIYPPSIRRFFGTYWQVIPWSAARHAHVRAGVRRIPTERILWIQFPKKLGGRRKLHRILKELAYISKEVVPKFQMKLMGDQKSGLFDFSKYTWNRYVFKGKITRKYGWDQRKHGDDDMLEYYSLLRYLRFSKTESILRQHIVSKLNDLLKSPYVGIPNRIELEGLPTPEGIESQIERLKKGDLEFKSVYDYVNISS